MKTTQFDLALLDIRMPGMSGIDLYQTLEKTMPSVAKRIVFITGDTIGDDTREFLSRTKAHYIIKPFIIGELKAYVRRILDESHQEL